MKLLLLTLFAFAHAAAADPTRDAAWVQDLDYLTTQLPQLHPNLFSQTPREVFDRAAADLRDAIPTLPDTDVMVRMAAIVALAGDGHTSLTLTQRLGWFRLLPIRVKWFSDGLYIISASPDYPRALRARVRRIGSMDVEDAYRAVAATISHDTEIWARESSPDYLVNADLLRALGVADSSDSVHFDLEDQNGPFELDVASLAAGVSTPLTAAPDLSTGYVPLYQRNRNLNYWFTYIESSRTLYFAYNACQQMASLPFAQFNDQLWAVFDSKPVERLLIDLRNNPGGNSSILDPFLTSGALRAGRFFSVRPILIISGKTFSSAVLNAVEMKQGPVTVVGQPTGWSPSGFGEVQTLTLPNSGLVVSYSTKQFSSPRYPTGPMPPDVTVPISSTDYFARHDPFLAAAIADVLPSADPAVPSLQISADPVVGAGGTFPLAMSGPGTDDTSAVPRVYAGAEFAAVNYSGPGLLTVTLPAGAGLAGETPVFLALKNAFSNPAVVRIGN